MFKIHIPSIIMSTVGTVDQFNTTEDEISMPTMNIESNNVSLIWWLIITLENSNACSMYEGLLSCSCSIYVICYSDEVVVTCCFYYIVQQNDCDYHVPNGTAEEQASNEEIICPKFFNCHQKGSSRLLELNRHSRCSMIWDINLLSHLWEVSGKWFF